MWLPIAERSGLQTGVAMGIAAWLVSLSLTFLVKPLVVMPFDYSIPPGPVGGTIAIHHVAHIWLLLGRGFSTYVVLTILIIVVLAVAGYYARSRTPKLGAARTGAFIAIGYGTMTIIGWLFTYLFTMGRSLLVVGGVVVLVALAYAIVFGGIGGLIAGGA